MPSRITNLACNMVGRGPQNHRTVEPPDGDRSFGLQLVKASHKCLPVRGVRQIDVDPRGHLTCEQRGGEHIVEQVEAVVVPEGSANDESLSRLADDVENEPVKPFTVRNSDRARWRREHQARVGSGGRSRTRGCSEDFADSDKLGSAAQHGLAIICHYAGAGELVSDRGGQVVVTWRESTDAPLKDLHRCNSGRPSISADLGEEIGDRN